jgi:hypothetical protein
MSGDSGINSNVLRRKLYSIYTFQFLAIYLLCFLLLLYPHQFVHFSSTKLTCSVILLEHILLQTKCVLVHRAHRPCLSVGSLACLLALRGRNGWFRCRHRRPRLHKLTADYLLAGLPACPSGCPSVVVRIVKYGNEATSAIAPLLLLQLARPVVRQPVELATSQKSYQTCIKKKVLCRHRRRCRSFVSI